MKATPFEQLMFIIRRARNAGAITWLDAVRLGSTAARLARKEGWLWTSR
jgi:hypothetical protein